MSDAGGAMLSLGSAAATNGVPNPLPQLSSVLHALAQRICRCEMQNTEIQDEKWQIQNQLRQMESLALADWNPKQSLINVENMIISPIKPLIFFWQCLCAPQMAAERIWAQAPHRENLKKVSWFQVHRCCCHNCCRCLLTNCNKICLGEKKKSVAEVNILS